MKITLFLAFACFILVSDVKAGLNTFTLYDYSNKAYTLPDPANVAPLPKEYVNVPITVIVHGFTNPQAPWAIEMKNEILRVNQPNYNYVIIVDWLSPSKSGYDYLKDAENTEVVGKDLSLVIKRLGGLNVHCIGHSLGSHVCGWAGYYAQQNYNLKFRRISGLDPAGPYFISLGRKQRLDSDDANFVDVYHTNQGLGFVEGSLGLNGPIGHADFYPNGGHKQPGCGFRANFKYIFNLELDAFKDAAIACSHGRAHQFYLESIRNRTCFSAYRCTSQDDLAKCQKTSKITYGYFADPRNTGEFYLTTGDKAPFCSLKTN